MSDIEDKLLELKINFIINNFDYEKVYKTMIALDWKWFMKNLSYRTPSIDEMKEINRKYLKYVYEFYKSYKDDEIEPMVSSGGFYYKIIEEDNEKDFILKMSFEVASTESTYIEEEIPQYNRVKKIGKLLDN
jgi:uncharacterized protein YaaW (UPF0174 family)